MDGEQVLTESSRGLNGGTILVRVKTVDAAKRIRLDTQ
jgi:hypothetical protein